MVFSGETVGVSVVYGAGVVVADRKALSVVCGAMAVSVDSMATPMVGGAALENQREGSNTFIAKMHMKKRLAVNAAANETVNFASTITSKDTAFVLPSRR